MRERTILIIPVTWQWITSREVTFGLLPLGFPLKAIVCRSLCLRATGSDEIPSVCDWKAFWRLVHRGGQSAVDAIDQSCNEIACR